MLESVYKRNVNNDNCSFKTVGFWKDGTSLVLGHMASTYGMCIFFPECYLPTVC